MFSKSMYSGAKDIIMAFEGLKSGKYTQEEVFQDFIEDMEGSHDALLKPLQEVTSALETVADEVPRNTKWQVGASRP